MQFTLLFAVALFVVSAMAQHQELFMNTPKEVVQCGEVLSTWSQGVSPYNLIVVDANDPCGVPVVKPLDTDETFASWVAAIASGTKIQISVADSQDNEVWSANITVAASNDSSCLTTAVGITGSAGLPAADPITGSTPDATGSDSSSTGTATPSNVPAPLGAANAGTNSLFNSALSRRQANMPIMAFSAIAAIALLAL